MYKKFKTYLYHTETIAIVKYNIDGSSTSFTEGVDCPDYQEYLKWLEEGNTPLPADEISE